MGLPSGTFNTGRSGTLQVVFSGRWQVDGAEWASGADDLQLRCYVGEGATRRTAMIGLRNPTATVEVPYTADTSVAVGMEYVLHGFDLADEVAALDLRIACHVIAPAQRPRVLRFADLLQMLRDERAPVTATPTPAPWLTDISGTEWFVRSLSELATETETLTGALDEIGFKAFACDPLNRRIDPASMVATSTFGAETIEARPVVRDDVPGGYCVKIFDGHPDGFYELTYRCVPAGTYDGTSLGTPFAGIESVAWWDIEPGDTLWVCGTFVDETVNIQASGTAGAWLKVRLDHPSMPAVIRQATEVNPASWQSEPNGEYSIYMKTPNNMVFEDGERLYGTSVSSRVRTLVTATDVDTDTITFVNPRLCTTGKAVVVPRDFSDARLPAGLEFQTTYYLIVLSFTGTPNFSGNVTYQCKLAASYADALAGTPVDILDAGDGQPWFLWVTQAEYPYYDPIPGSLQPGQFGYDPLTLRLFYKPSSGTPADHVVEVSNDKTTFTGSGLYMLDRSYVRVMGGGEYGGLFGTPCVGRIERCHLNGILVQGGSDVVIDGVEVDGARSAIVFQGTVRAVARNGWYRNLAWHACGAERTTDSEPDMILERNRIGQISRQADFGDAQATVTNPGSHRTHMRRNFVDQNGRNTQALNTGTAVIDSSEDVMIYWNWWHRCQGDVVEVGSGTGGPALRGRVIGNVCTQGNIETLPESEKKQDRPAFVLCAQSGTLELNPISLELVAGNLVADSNYRTRAGASNVTGGCFYLRSPNTQPNAVQAIVRNAVLSPDGAVYSVHRTGVSQLMPVIEYSDYNLFAATPEFAHFQTGATKSPIYTGAQIQGAESGAWSFDQGHDLHSELAVRALGDPLAEPTTEMLEFLRDDDHLDSYDTGDFPGMHCVGSFPFNAVLEP